MSDSQQDNTALTEQGWRQKTLKAAGVGYIAADFLGIGASLARGKSLGSMAGFATWFTGGLAAARYANPDSDKQLELQGVRLQSLMERKGIVIPEDARTKNRLLRQPGFWQKCEAFVYEHPSEVLNFMFALGAAGFLQTGWKNRHHKPLLPKSFKLRDLESINADAGMGLFVMAGALSGLLIKEDPEAPQKAAQGSMMDKTIAFVKEKPLRLTGTLYALNNIYAAIGFLGDCSRAKHRNGIQPMYLSGPMAAIYVLSNLMISLSSRSQATTHRFSPSALAELQDAAIHIIAAQPPYMQQVMTEDISQYLASQKGVATDAVTLKQQINQKRADLTAPASPLRKNSFVEALTATRHAAAMQSSGHAY